jgi:signal transduction histidine kinase
VKRFWTLSLRVRLMIIGLAGVSTALIMGGLAFFGALTYSVDRTLDSETLNTAQEVAAMVNENRLPSPIPVSGAQVVQVVDAQQRVIGGSLTADRLTPLLLPNELARALVGEAVVVAGVRLGISGPLRVRAIEAAPGPTVDTGPVSIIVGLPFGDVLATRTALRNALLISFPLLLGILGLIAWRVIGWTLRPVEQLRAGAPLASISAQLEVAQRLGEGGTLPDELMVDVKRLVGLVEDLLLLARADADTRPPARSVPVAASDLVSEVIQAYSDARVPVTVAASEQLMIMVDPEELRRAVGNLIDNAVRHAASRVAVAAFLDHDQVVISVSDDGPGIPAEDRERVFERFRRLDDARGRNSGGAGLGLAIVRELITRAGGTVRLTRAEPPWNLRAELRLPSAEAQQLRTDLVTRPLS